MSVRRYGSGGPWEESFGYSRVVAAGPLVLTAGCTSTVDGKVAHVGDPAGQARQAFRIALDALGADHDLQFMIGAISRRLHHDHGDLGAWKGRERG